MPNILRNEANPEHQRPMPNVAIRWLLLVLALLLVFQAPASGSDAIAADADG